MLKILRTALVFVLLLGTIAQPSFAGDDKEPLFINLTSDDTWRAGMALQLATTMVKHGHPSTVFLNVEAVRLAATNMPQHHNAVTKSTPQEMLEAFMDAGGTVIVCPMCLKQAGLEQADLMDGPLMGKPEVTGPALFADDVRVLSY